MHRNFAPVCHQHIALMSPENLRTLRKLFTVADLVNGEEVTPLIFIVLGAHPSIGPRRCDISPTTPALASVVAVVFALVTLYHGHKYVFAFESIAGSSLHYHVKDRLLKMVPTKPSATQNSSSRSRINK
jgi:hypothetical protein